MIVKAELVDKIPHPHSPQSKGPNCWTTQPFLLSSSDHQIRHITWQNGCTACLDEKKEGLLYSFKTNAKVHLS